jgi:hypothetical protein
MKALKVFLTLLLLSLAVKAQYETNEVSISEYNYNLIRTDQDGNVVWIRPIEVNTANLSDNRFIIYGFGNIKNGKLANKPSDYDYWLIKNDTAYNATIYPNPTSSYVNVMMNNFANGLRFFLYDINGVLIISERLAQYNNKIELPDLANGIYICKVTFNNEIIKIDKLCVLKK